ncbi:HD domain-containing protein [Tautonia marina]|uniref:HD domain-containing protein n=1 Tax=Tautonia marina TaxID=2653855 RepID=UPI0012612E9D|nr:HD domain-containing protein [Tautonia marina]
MTDPLSPRFERALRWATIWHDGQHRKASPTPYVQHPIAVAWILDRLGYDEDVVIAALLHDVVEDTEATLDDIRERFGDRVADLVAHCSERKTDDEGRQRPWIDRKRDHLEALMAAPEASKAIVLADCLHNMRSMVDDLAQEGEPFWNRFNARRDQIFTRFRMVLERLGEGEDDRLRELARLGRLTLAELGGPSLVEEPSGPGQGSGPDQLA